MLSGKLTRESFLHLFTTFTRTNYITDSYQNKSISFYYFRKFFLKALAPLLPVQVINLHFSCLYLTIDFDIVFYS